MSGWVGSLDPQRIGKLSMRPRALLARRRAYFAMGNIQELHAAQCLQHPAEHHTRNIISPAPPHCIAFTGWQLAVVYVFASCMVLCLRIKSEFLQLLQHWPGNTMQHITEDVPRAAAITVGLHDSSAQRAVIACRIKDRRACGNTNMPKADGGRSLHSTHARIRSREDDALLNAGPQICEQSRTMLRVMMLEILLNPSRREGRTWGMRIICVGACGRWGGGAATKMESLKSCTCLRSPEQERMRHSAIMQTEKKPTWDEQPDTQAKPRQTL